MVFALGVITRPCLSERLWLGMLIITATPVSFNVIIGTMHGGFDCLRLFWPAVSHIVVLGLEGQVLDLGIDL